MNTRPLGSPSEVNSRVDASFTSLIDRVHVARGVGRMAVLLICTFAFFAALKPSVFLNPLNLQNIGVATPEIGLLALAVMVAMLTGGIDLSVVAIANATAITISTLYTMFSSGGENATGPLTTVLIVLAALLVALVLGVFNGILVSIVGITPILATLATWQVYNGLALVWTGGVTISGAPPGLVSMGSATVAGVPVLMVIFVVVAAVLAVIINRTPLGKKIQLQGSNPVATRYSGINTRSTLMLTYIVSGMLAGIAGVLFISRNPSASADYGASYILLAIVIVVLGGTNPNGGFATVLGVVLAALTLQVVSSGFTALRLSAYEYAIAQGVILIAVMILDQVSLKRSRSRPKNRVKTSTPISATN